MFNPKISDGKVKPHFIPTVRLLNKYFMATERYYTKLNRTLETKTLAVPPL